MDEPGSGAILAVDMDGARVLVFVFHGGKAAGQRIIAGKCMRNSMLEPVQEMVVNIEG